MTFWAAEIENEGPHEIRKSDHYTKYSPRNGRHIDHLKEVGMCIWIDCYVHIYNFKKKNSCEIEDRVETHIRQLCVILRPSVLGFHMAHAGNTVRV